MTSQYKITYRYIENGLTKEDEEIIVAEKEPTKDEARKYFGKGSHNGVGSISIVSIAPYP